MTILIFIFLIFKLTESADYLGIYPNISLTQSYSPSIAGIHKFTIRPASYLRTKVFFQDDIIVELQNIIQSSIYEITNRVMPNKPNKGGILYVKPCLNDDYYYSTFEENVIKVCRQDCVTNQYLHPNITQRCFRNKNNEYQVVDSINKLLVNLDLFISVGLVNCSNNKHMSYAGPIQLAYEDDRPEIGLMAICNNTMLTDIKNKEYIKQAIQHDLVHILAFFPSLYAYYRDNNGAPTTKRTVHGVPDNGVMDYLGIAKFYKPDPRVLHYYEKEEKQINGSFVKVVRPILSNHHLNKISDDYYRCKKISGVFLEDYKEPGVYMSHFEKRIFNDELMTAGLKSVNVLSIFTVSLLQGSGWYQVSAKIDPSFNFGNKAHCDFLMLSCMEYLESREKRNLPTIPFCRTCNDMVHTPPLPSMCMTFNVTNEDAHSVVNKYNTIYPDPYAEYCPITYADYRIVNSNLTLDNVCVKSNGVKLTHDETSVPLKMKVLKKFCVNNVVEVVEKELFLQESMKPKITCSDQYRMLVGVKDRKFQCFQNNQTIPIQLIADNVLWEYNFSCDSCEKYCLKPCKNATMTWKPASTRLFPHWTRSNSINMNCIGDRAVFTKTLVYKN